MDLSNTSTTSADLSYTSHISTMASDTVSDDITRGILNATTTFDALNATTDFEVELAQYKTEADYIEHKIGQILYMYLLPCIIVIGIFGNVMSIIVLRCSSMYLNASTVYLLALAISDALALIVAAGRVWLLNMWDIRLRIVHEWVCKLHHLSTYTLLDFSAWLLVALSVDRVITVYMPLRAKLMCTRIRAVAVTLCILLALLLINGHYLFTVGYFIKIVNDRIIFESNCYFVEGTKTFHTKYWFWIDAFVASLLPFLFLTISNVMIVIQLIRSSQQRRQTMQAVSNSTADSQTRSITIMLICLSITFLILTAPVVFFFIADQTLNISFAKDDPERHHRRAKSHMNGAIVFCLMYTNNAINFIMYCLSGKKFRSSLVEVFCGSKRRRNILKDSTTSLATSRSTLATSDVSQSS